MIRQLTIQLSFASPRCPLCDQDLTDHAPEHYFGLELCRACGLGQVVLPLRDPSQRLEVSYSPRMDDARPPRPATIVADGQLEHAPTIAVSFWRRRWWSALIETITGRIRTGDDVFDKNVWVYTRNPGSVRRLLASHAVRASLMDCVVSGEMRVQAGTVSCRRVDNELGVNDVNETTRAVLILMHQLRNM